MEISFSLQNDVQVISIAGTIGEAETAAIRFKLDQKINQGRKKVCYDLATFDSGSADCQKYLLDLIEFGMNRGVRSVICNLPTEFWPKYATVKGQKVPLFQSQMEAIHHLSTESGSSASSPSGEKEEGKESSEKEIKDKLLQELLSKYESYWHRSDYDPHRLDFVADQYKAKQTDMALVVESTARKNATELKEYLATKQKEAEELASSLEYLMGSRKAPLSADEVQLKLSTSKKDNEALLKEIGELGAKEKTSEDLLGKMAEKKKQLDYVLKSAATKFKEEEENLKKEKEAKIAKWKKEDEEADQRFKVEKSKLEQEIKAKTGAP